MDNIWIQSKLESPYLKERKRGREGGRENEREGGKEEERMRERWGGG